MVEIPAGNPLATLAGRFLGAHRVSNQIWPATGVFTKARWTALARPVELLLARAEVLLALELELELEQGFGLPCTPKMSQAGMGQA